MAKFKYLTTLPIRNDLTHGKVEVHKPEQTSNGER